MGENKIVHICDDCLRKDYDNFPDVIKSIQNCFDCGVKKSCTNTSHFTLKTKKDL